MPLICWLIVLGAHSQSYGITEYKNLGYIVVSPSGPDDDGDYGPNTPGTTTSGIQEALNYARENSRDVYIAGGPSAGSENEVVTYYLSETLYVPWGQQWHLDGGEYRLVYTPNTGDAVFIEGQGNCYIKFGTIIGGKSPDQVVVRLKPTVVGPDDQINCHAATFVFNGIIGSGGIQNPEPADNTGIGMYIDGTLGTAGVQNSSFYFGQISSCRTGLYLKTKVNANMFKSPSFHDLDTAIQVGESGTTETVAANMFEGIISSCNSGVRVFGKKNFFKLSLDTFLPQQAFIFESSAYNNMVISSYLPQGFTDNTNLNLSNRIITSKSIGYGVVTPSVPASGNYGVNTNSFPVEVQIITTGNVTEWLKADSTGYSGYDNAQTFNGGFTVGQRIVLDPGFKLKLTYSTPPTWRWMGLD